MTRIELATTIGNVLTSLDTILQNPNLSDTDFQTLFALRKHLDDEQRDLIKASISEADAQYQALSSQLQAANTQLQSTIADLTKVGNVINIVSQIASYADQILGLAK